MDDKIKLNVLGITYSQVQQGAYALVLEQENGPCRIPVVVGVAEAQAIAVKLEGIIPPRPMPHDIMVCMAHGFGISLDEVFIYKFDEGIFMSELHLSNEERKITVDSRTSDAIALAMRTGAPIFTTPEVLQQTGFLAPDDDDRKPKRQSSVKGNTERHGLNDLTIEKLEGILSQCVEREEYERAAEIKHIIDEKKHHGEKTERQL